MESVTALPGRAHFPCSPGFLFKPSPTFSSLDLVILIPRVLSKSEGFLQALEWNTSVC